MKKYGIILIILGIIIAILSITVAIIVFYRWDNIIYSLILVIIPNIPAILEVINIWDEMKCRHKALKLREMEVKAKLPKEGTFSLSKFKIYDRNKKNKSKHADIHGKFKLMNENFENATEIEVSFKFYDKKGEKMNWGIQIDLNDIPLRKKEPLDIPIATNPIGGKYTICVIMKCKEFDKITIPQQSFKIPKGYENRPMKRVYSGY